MNFHNSINYEVEKDFWFNQIESHGNDVFNYGGNYYIAKILNAILPHLDVPTTGKVCMLGTHNCHSFSLLEQHFGKERCIGFDLSNPTQRKNIMECPIREYPVNSIPSISFCWNDLANFSRAPYDKIYAPTLLRPWFYPFYPFWSKDVNIKLPYLPK